MNRSGLVDARKLPASPLDAAAHFHGQIVPAIRQGFDAGGDLIVMFDSADHSHDGWRLAAIQELAREAAPAGRINGIVGNGQDVQSTAATMHFLHTSPGITGQIFTVDGNSPQNG